MRDRGVLAASLFVVALSAAPLLAQGTKVEILEVVDNRVNHEMIRGSLSIQVSVSGASADKASAARLIVKEARDDKGNDLHGDAKPPDFRARNENAGRLEISLRQPPRDASSVRVKGNVELFVPSRDPNAVIKIPKAFSKLDAPLNSKGLKTAKLTLTPLSREKYLEQRKAFKVTPEKIEELRAEAKKQGADEKEIELAIAFATAMDAMDGSEELTDSTLILGGSEDDFDRIHSVELLDAAGNELSTRGRSTSTRGEVGWMILNLAEPPPSDAALRLTLLTDKAKMSVPFELKNIELP